MFGRVLVTGGAGFTGSHLVDTLMTYNSYVKVFDNLSSGSIENIRQWMDNRNFQFVRGDLLNLSKILQNVRNVDVVFHLAANPEVRTGLVSPEIHFQNNVVATYNLLEAIRKNANIKLFVFTSSSTVYGEPSKLPTPENYSPLMPISMYGASKLACEALIASYSHTYGIKAVIFRLANIVGPRNRHGVIYDFIVKLRKDPKELEILGDGTQTKSYLYINDCIDAIILAMKKARKSIEIFNVGSEDQINVKRIAEIIIDLMGLQSVKFKFTGGVNGGRGWKGDVKTMLLDISKLKSLGWKPEHNSEESVRKAAESLVNEIG
jgi:UDP-glucose 4-epimerase